MQMLFEQPQPLPMPLADPYQTEAELEPIFQYVTEANRQPLINEHVRYMNANETTVQAATVQAHIEDIYTPGDRLQDTQPRSRKSLQKRQPPRPGGFLCDFEGCDGTFDRACELK
jgi:hypothetical protein